MRRGLQQTLNQRIDSNQHQTWSSERVILIVACNERRIHHVTWWLNAHTSHSTTDDLIVLSGFYICRIFVQILSLSLSLCLSRGCVYAVCVSFSFLSVLFSGFVPVIVDVMAIVMFPTFYFSLNWFDAYGTPGMSLISTVFHMKIQFQLLKMLIFHCLCKQLLQRSTQSQSGWNSKFWDLLSDNFITIRNNCTNFRHEEEKIIASFRRLLCKTVVFVCACKK